MERSLLAGPRDWRALGMRIKQLREAAGKSQTEVAKAAGVSVSYISVVESGNHRPMRHRLRRLAQALGTSYPELAQLAGYASDPERNA